MNKTLLKSALFIALLPLFALIFRVEGASAQTAEGVSVKPALIEERMNPGDSYSSVLRVTNMSVSEKTFNVFAKDIVGTDEAGGPIFSSGTERTAFEFGSWVTLPITKITIGSNETKEVPFTVRVPQNAGPGGHFGGVFLNIAGSEQKTIGSGIGYEVGALMNFRISGDIVEEAQIREFSTDKAIYSRPNVNFRVRVENLGNVLIRPRGPLEITNSFGKKVGTIVVNEGGAGVFPKSARTFEVKWNESGLMLGRYQALLGLVYGGDARKTVSQVISFWVIPGDIIMIGFGAILALILALIFSVKLYIRRKLRQMGADQGRAAAAGDSDFGRAFAPLSRLAFIAIALIVFTLIFLLVLLLFFA